MKNKKLFKQLPILSLIVIFIIDFTFIVSTHLSWDSSMKKYIPLQQELALLENDLSKAHLWFEEAIGGDKYIDIEKDVMIPFMHLSFEEYLNTMDSVLDEEEDRVFLQGIEEIDFNLDVFYTIAQKRWTESVKHGIGSDADQEFDALFNEIVDMIDDLLLQIDTKISNELVTRNSYFTWILGLFILINFTAFYMLFRAKQKQENYEDSLAEEKERLFVTLRSIGDAVVVTDMHGDITFMNIVAEELTEYSTREVSGSYIDNVLHLENMKSGKRIDTPIYDVLHNKLTKLISNGTKLISKSGKEYIVSDSAAPVINHDGEIFGTVLVFQNDTKRHETEEALRRSEAQYRSLIESVKNHYFFYAHDVNGIFQYISNSVLDVLGYSKNEFQVHYTEYLTDDPMNKTVGELTEQSIRGNPQKPYTLSIYHSDGSVKYLEVTESPVFDEDGQVISVEGVARDVTQNYLAQKSIMKQKELLDHKAHHDTLTNLPNRALFLDRLTQSIGLSKRLESMSAVLFIDLDHFKSINDSFGHHIGDEVLTQTAFRLEGEIRSTDTLARLGGDEFTIVLNNISDTSLIIHVIKKLMEVMQKPMEVETQQFYITLSIGVSIYPNDGERADVLLKNADAAMYKAKDEGRNTYHFYTEDMTQKAFERIFMENALRQAIGNEEFLIYYQVQVNALDQSIIGMEALVRWKHISMGMVSPVKFIDLAEEIGLIISIDRWVMRMGMLQLVQWYKNGLNPGVLAFNLSIKQLEEENFFDVLNRMLEETGCKPEWIELEVTEGQIMKNPSRAIEILKQISELGIGVSVDDFGTGYSSLSYLKRLPISKLKIDQSFIVNLPSDEEDVGIAQAIIALAKSLNLKIIAEGVETKEQVDFLIENGCENIQGYYYSKPIEAKELQTLLENGVVL